MASAILCVAEAIIWGNQPPTVSPSLPVSPHAVFYISRQWLVWNAIALVMISLILSFISRRRERTESSMRCCWYFYSKVCQKSSTSTKSAVKSIGDLLANRLSVWSLIILSAGGCVLLCLNETQVKSIAHEKGCQLRESQPCCFIVSRNQKWPTKHLAALVHILATTAGIRVAVWKLPGGARGGD